MRKLFFLVSFIFSSVSSFSTANVVDSTNSTGFGSLGAVIDSVINGDAIRFYPNLIANVVMFNLTK